MERIPITMQASNAIGRATMLAMTFAVICVLIISKVAQGAADVAELAHTRSQSSDGVVLLTDELLQTYVVGRSRPYTVAIFFSAAQVLEANPNLRMEDLRTEYGLAAKAFARGPDADKIFFFEASLETSQKPFAIFQVNALPCIVRIPPNQAVSLSTVELPRSDKMLPDTIGTRDYPWPAETFIDFLGKRHGLSAAEVDRPSLIKSPLFPVVAGVLVAAALFAAYKIYSMALLRHSAIWALLSLAVFWFSASGGMYNIIRGVPFFIRDRNGRLQFFLSGRQGQLGAEGFVLGSLYLVVSCSLAFITFLAPRIRSRLLRDSASVVGAVLAAGSLYQTFLLWTKKTGYRHVFYF